MNEIEVREVAGIWMVSPGRMELSLMVVLILKRHELLGMKNTMKMQEIRDN